MSAEGTSRVNSLLIDELQSRLRRTLIKEGRDASVSISLFLLVAENVLRYLSVLHQENS